MFYNVSVTFQRNSFWKTFSERDSHSSINRFWKTLEKNGLLPNQKRKKQQQQQDIQNPVFYCRHQACTSRWTPPLTARMVHSAEFLK